MDIVIKTTFSYTPEYTFIDTDGDVIVTIDEKEQKAIKDAMLILKENQAFFCIEVDTGDPEVVEDEDGELRFGHTCYRVYRTGGVYWHGQTKYDSADQYEAYLFHINDDADLTFNLPE